MKKITLKNKEEIKICTDIEEVTFLESELFKQYFAKILYDIDLKLFEDFKYELYELLNKQKFAESVLKLQNYSQSLAMQDIKGNAWAICFAIIMKKPEPNINESELFELFEEVDKKGIDEKILRESVVNFSNAFPILSHIYKIRSEGLRVSELMSILT